ncbi:hypothetical protein M407DRAFT_30970 [Tulasnella calospora MUT 4182]|uniref:Uncharacterized protein n=1 Tax=Tulasnella calospora MUT 4182 TaxID=1051891 RepID=A0A0C3Q6H8_9AGAM|nr:hypothetical protein M407DRAFT_30970 [Tulasnella calospora MUT 4182]
MTRQLSVLLCHLSSLSVLGVVDWEYRPSIVQDGWLNFHSLKKSKPVFIALGVITLVTVFVGTQFTIGEDGFDFRGAGKGGVVPEEVLFLVGPPANSIRENLNPGVQYVTGWNAGGMTNVIMPYNAKLLVEPPLLNLQVHVVYTAMLSDRVAIIPPLTPDLAHVGGKPKQVPPINFGEIFDIGKN